MLTKILIIAAAFVAVFAFVTMRSAFAVSGEDARAAVDAGAILVDVRTPAEFAAGHIDGAVNIPVDGLAQRVSELGDPTGAVVVYCRSGARSSRAKGMLERAGFTTVSDLGAMSNWR